MRNARIGGLPGLVIWVCQAVYHEFDLCRLIIRDWRHSSRSAWLYVASVAGATGIVILLAYASAQYFIDWDERLRAANPGHTYGILGWIWGAIGIALVYGWIAALNKLRWHFVPDAARWFRDGPAIIGDQIAAILDNGDVAAGRLATSRLAELGLRSDAGSIEGAFLLGFIHHDESVQSLTHTALLQVGAEDRERGQAIMAGMVALFQERPDLLPHFPGGRDVALRMWHVSRDSKAFYTWQKTREWPTLPPGV